MADNVEKDFTEEILAEDAQDAAEELINEANAEAPPEKNEEGESVEDTEETKVSEDGEEIIKKNFFGMKKEKKEKKDKKDIQIEELTDRAKRTMAEFDNYRKRTDKEKAAMFEVGAKSVIEKILPVVDNFERGLAAVPEEDKNGAFVDGMDKIYKQFMKTLEELGVEPIEAVGKEFDPNLHNAVLHEENEELGENIVAAEFQKGYTYKGTVVRHSMVQVAN
ncbi:MAG: nucleotide exchange factor GrpE [Lachnospiraceae bacterium]